MVRDPEQEPARWDEPILAESPQQARQECQRRADQYGIEVEYVQAPSRIEPRPQLYRCHYKEKE
ncbi:MAG: hypothetical protein RBJ76_04965 [Stenomitos frigidus ULC029]